MVTAPDGTVDRPARHPDLIGEVSGKFPRDWLFVDVQSPVVTFAITGP